MRNAPHPVDVHAVDRDVAERSILQLQVAVDSVLGAITFHTGGIVIDDGWLRLLGGGGEPALNVVTANGLDDDTGSAPPYLLVATDVMGGQFALDGGRLLGRPMEICYFAPDALEWEALEAGYASFVAWSMSASLGDFYAPYRWDGWEDEVPIVGPAEAISTDPPLWSIDGDDIAGAARRVVPWTQHAGALRDAADQLAGLPTA